MFSKDKFFSQFPETMVKFLQKLLFLSESSTRSDDHSNFVMDAQNTVLLMEYSGKLIDNQ